MYCSIQLNCVARRRRLPAIALVCSLFVLLCRGGDALAADVTWDNVAGGDFSEIGNWSPSEIPEAGDTAVFNLPDSYIVHFAADQTTSKLRVRKGNVTFDLDGFAYSAADLPPEVAAIIGDETGDDATLTTRGGSVDMGRTTIGNLPGSAGILNVDDGTNFDAGLLFVGRQGAGVLNITNGSVVHSAGAVMAAFDGSVASGLVDGIGSRLDVSAAFFVATGVSTAELTLSNGGQLITGGPAGVGGGVGTGIMTITGAGSQWTAKGEATIAEDGAGDLHIVDGGRFVSSLVDVGGLAGAGRVLVSGSDSLWHNSGDVFVGGVRGIAGGVGAITISDGGTLRVDGKLMLLPQGSLIVDNGNVQVGQLELSGATLAGDFSVTGDLRNSGVIAPGNSPGVATVDGDFLQTSLGTLKIELGGALPELNYDQLLISGNAELGGLLNVSFFDGFVPEAGAVFQIVEGRSISGSFSQISLPELPTGMSWQTEYGQESVRLLVNIVPEPASMTLFVIAMLGMLTYWRRRMA